VDATVIVRRRERWKWPVVAGMGLISASALFPLYFLISNALRTNADYAGAKVGLPTTFSADALQRAWEGASVPTYLRNSLIVVVGTVALSVLVATCAAYSFSKLRWTAIHTSTSR
jgi:ABC-type glycerol-3-phosphate transport system permease component